MKSIYDLYSNPKELKWYSEARDFVPDVFFDVNNPKRARNEKQLKAIASEPLYAYDYAIDVIEGRWPEGEKAIASDPGYAYLYASHVIKGRFPEGEKAIASDPDYAYDYAIGVIRPISEKEFLIWNIKFS